MGAFQYIKNHKKEIIIFSTTLLIFAGLFAGLCISTKPIFLLFAPAIALVFFIRWRKGGLTLMDFLYFTISATIPLIFWFYVQFGFNESISSILSFYMNPFQEKNVYSAIFENLRHFVSDSGPIYLLIMLFVWFAGIILRRRKNIDISSSEMAAFAFSLLISVGYLKTNGWYRFIFPAQAVSFIYFPKSISLLVEFMGERLNHRIFTQFTRFFWIVPVFCFAVLGIYQTMFSSFVAEAYKSDKTAFWEHYFKNIPSKQVTFFYNVPEVAALDFGGKYYQYISPAGWQIGSSGLEVIDSGEADSVILRTDAFEGNENRFSKYRSQLKAYKYTILIKK